MRNFNEERYRFAVQQFEEKNYDVAYDTFLKIRGYENSVGYIEKIEKIKDLKKWQSLISYNRYQ